MRNKQQNKIWVFKRRYIHGRHRKRYDMYMKELVIRLRLGFYKEQVTDSDIGNIVMSYNERRFLYLNGLIDGVHTNRYSPNFLEFISKYMRTTTSHKEMKIRTEAIIDNVMGKY